MRFGGEWTLQSSSENMTGCLGSEGFNQINQQKTVSLPVPVPLANQRLTGSGAGMVFKLPRKHKINIIAYVHI